MARIPGRHFARNLIERRALIVQLVRRDFHQRYVGSAAGWLWGVAAPLVVLASYYFVFQVCLKTPPPQDGLTDSYTAFLFAGVLPWLLFSETVTRSAGSLVEQSNLITRTVFPSEVLPVSIFFSGLIQHLIGVVLAVAWIGFYAKSFSPMVFLLPLYMVFVGMLAIGIGWIAASLHVYLRDTGQVLGVLMTFWFWVTPIMISEDRVPAKLRPLITLNPMSWVVKAYRQRLLSPSWPTLHELAILTAYCGAVFVIGGLFFRHLKRGFADVL